MEDTIKRLTVIYHYAKDIHYNAKGESFYSTHLLMDRVADGIMEQIDQINEICFLGMGKPAPDSQNILKNAADDMPQIWNNDWENIEQLKNYIGGTIENILEIEQNNEVNSAEASLLDDIAKSLMQKKGLLLRTITAK